MTLKTTIKTCFFLSLLLVIMVSSVSAASSAKYGFWPYYVDANSYQPDWNGLSHVVYFYSEVNSNGVISSPNFPNNYKTVRDQAHSRGKKVIISVWTATPTDIDNIIANHKTDFAKNVVSLMQSNGADGINLDFEYPSDINTVTKTSNAPIFEQFMKTLYTTVKAANPSYQVSLCLGWDVKDVPTYKNTSLSNDIDNLFFMGYDYHGWVGTTSGANSPFDDATQYDTVDSINDLLKYYPSGKIVFGMPLYCWDSVTSSGSKGANIISISSIGIKDAITNSQQYGRTWDSNSNTPWYKYQSGSTWHQVWYDDKQSLQLKVNYSDSLQLGGVGFYPLGSESPDIWSVFTSTSNGGSTNNPPAQTPIASFSASPKSGRSPLRVTFTDKSTGSITNWIWNFGDGYTSTDQNTAHTYSRTGRFTASLTVSNSAGGNVSKMTIAVTRR